MKNRHLRARLPEDEYRALQIDADVVGLTLSEHIRNALLRDRMAHSQEQFIDRLDAKLAMIQHAPAAASIGKELEPFLVESLLLIRELVAERNAQALGRTAQHLNKLYPLRKII